MSDERISAPEVVATVVCEATGRPRAEVVEILDLIPLPGPDRVDSPEEAQRYLVDMRGEVPLIAAWPRAGAARFEARLAGAYINANSDNRSGLRPIVSSRGIAGGPRSRRWVSPCIPPRCP